jgi:hypothetical protein
MSDIDPNTTILNERYAREINRGQEDGDFFITASGARVPRFVNQPGDEEMIDPGCIYCEGEGTWYEDDRSGSCYACSGTGTAGRTMARGDLRLEQWLDMVFFTDAPRFEKIDQDVCPDCGVGGCAGECHFTEEDWAEIYGPIGAG